MIKEYKVKFHEDDRAQRLQDVYKEGMADSQINISYINSTSHVVGWHAHTRQTEYWFVVKGALKVGIASALKDASQHEVNFEYLSDKNPRVIEIPPGVHHGYKALIPGTILMYFITEKYEKVSKFDDIRTPIGGFGESWETPNE
jgi:dTDP-4-dehydrorhamnose 3,5-epimerase-like enzyme